MNAVEKAQQKVMHGIEAAQFKDSPAFARAVETARRQIVLQMEESDLTDVALHNKLVVALHQLRAVQEMLEAEIRAGNFAAAELERASKVNRKVNG